MTLTVRAAQEVLLDRISAAGAALLGELTNPQLGRPRLDLPFTHVTRKVANKNDTTPASHGYTLAAKPTTFLGDTE